jgi:type I restriction enzyme, S subunit
VSPGWTNVALSEVLHPAQEWTTVDPSRTYREVTVKLWGKGVILRKEISGSEIRSERRLVVHAGQFILSRIDARNGAMGLVPQALDGAVVSNDFPVYDVNRERLDANFLGWLSRTEDFVNRCRLASEGTTNRIRLKEDSFLGMSVSLPPLASQRRILEYIQKLADRIDDVDQLIRRVSEEIAGIFDSAAAKAFNGTLDWGTVPLGELAAIRGGIQKGPHRLAEDNPVRYLTVAHVHRNRISLSNPRFFEVTPDELVRWRLESGDVLIIEGNGSAAQIGRTAVFRGEIPNCVHQNHVIRIRPDPERLEPDFLNFYLNSPAGQREVQARSRTTSDVRTLSVGRIEQIHVPISSLVKQRKLVGHLKEVERSADALRKWQTEAAAELSAVMPALLALTLNGPAESA